MSSTEKTSNRIARFAASSCLIAGLSLASASAFAADKVSVLLDWFVNPDHAPIVIAQSHGYFKEQGLDVELIAPSDSAGGPRLVAAGQADIGIYYQPSLLLDREAGVAVQQFGTLIETPLNGIISLADGPVQKLADLKGKSIGYSGFEDALLIQMLANGGLTTKDVKLINVNFDLVPALLSKQVDAIVGGYRNFEFNQMRLEGHPARFFYPEDNGVPPYDELIFITRPDLARDPRLPRFLAAIEKASIYLTNHPDEAWGEFIANHADLNNDLNKQAWRDTLPRFAKRPGAIDEGRAMRFAQFLKEHDQIKTVPVFSEFTINTAPHK